MAIVSTKSALFWASIDKVITNGFALIISIVLARLVAPSDFGVIATAMIFIITGKSFEAYLGILISILIIKSGIELVLQTVSEILGERIESNLSKQIKQTVVSCDSEITGAYDLTLNNYGPDKYLGSVHIEIPAGWNAAKIDSVTRTIQKKVYENHGVILSAVGIYSVNSKTSVEAKMKEKILSLAHDRPDILQIHGFYVDMEKKHISFDLVVSFDAPDMKACVKEFFDETEKLVPDYEINIQMDSDVSD